ncbi:Hypothetical Protein NG00_00409 [Corynebacterium camporealensis]|uniref:Uncharacterized protein n=1 Tax=Corynebacterium camporealensis TaxID=161896 RepID=A0A0F6QVL0_9CORY|nr:DUF3017 domain-containing protein [Corynebacterium camporealensis]AKE38435.1 Protein of unknown function (DUF3017) [Corynebacterium camporealensis]AVH87737.1 Hypothetical Protein NG00_00409 [Corynebacterium camporealensis]
MRAQLSNPHDVDLPASPLSPAVQWVAIALVVIGVAASGFFAITNHWRRAAFVLGLSLLWLSVVRLTCDSSRVGILAVRSRSFDAIYTAALGGLMVFLAYSVDALGS